MQREKKQEQQPIASLEKRLEGHNNFVYSVAVSPDGKWAVSSSWDETIKTWDMESDRCLKTMTGHKAKVNSVAITPDGTRIVSGSEDNTIRVWDAGTGNQQAKWKVHKEGILSLSILPHGDKVLSASEDKTLKLWDIDSGRCLKTFTGHTEAVRCVATAPDGKHAVSGSFDSTLKYWDLETGQCLATLKGHTSFIRAVQITPDGRRAVSGSADSTIKLWDLEKGACMGTFEGHQAEVYSVVISPDGRLAASSGFTDETVRIWDLKSFTCLQVLKDKEKFFFPVSLTFSPDGSRLVVGTTANTSYYSLYIYKLTDLSPAPAVTSSTRYTNAKIVLVGESGVGKSGLAHRLMEDAFIPTHSTHGMQIWPMDLPLPPQAGLQREALLWDLAGQEDYRLIHQLFLDETALALVLFNPQKEDPFAEVRDWVKILKNIACRDRNRDVPKLLIAARTDVGGITVSRAKIDRFLDENRFAHYLPTSAKTGQNCSDSQDPQKTSQLKQLIARHIPWDSLPWTSTPPLLRRLKNALLEMTETDDSPLLRFAELVRRLKRALPDHPFSDGDVRTAAQLVANHGLVLPLAFGDLLLLSPELLNGYASAVIRAARKHTDEIGAVAQQAVFQKTISFDGVHRLPHADEDLLLRAMVETFLDKSLCIAEDTPKGKQLIFPCQYRRERAIPSHPQVLVSYTFTGELATIYTTLVVRLWYSREFHNKELWRNAAEFMTATNNTAGLMMERTGEGEGTISVFFDTHVTDELKLMFIKYVHQHLEKYAADVTRDRRYLCGNNDCAEPVTNRKALRKRLDDGKTFITCSFCDEKIPLVDLIEQRLHSDPVAQKVMEMDARADKELDTQSLEQILIGQMMAVCGEANQIFRPVTLFDYGIDGEVEFKDEKGKASGKKIYVQLKSGDSYLRERKRDRVTLFDVKNPRHLDYWVNQPVDVYLVIRSSDGVIRWMNITRYLKSRPDKTSKQITFTGEKLDAAAIKRLRHRCLS